MGEGRSAAHDRAGAPATRRLLVDVSRWPAAVLLYSIVAAVVCFWRIGATGLVSMEGMVAEGARGMLESGEWVVPHLYGEIYTYKPAMAYWLASLPMRLVEDPSAALLRLPFAASGFFMGLAVLLLVGRVAGWRAGLLAALGSVTGMMFLLKGRMAEFDVTLTAGVGVAVAAAWFNLSVKRQRWGVWLLGYLALAVGFLTKGVPALAVFGPGLLAAAWAAGRFRRLFGWRHLSAALLFVAVVGSYLWAAWEAAGPAAFEQPLVEARIRGLGQVDAEDLAALPEARRFSGTEDGLAPGWPRALALAAVKPLVIWVAFLPWTMLLAGLLPRRDGSGRVSLDRPSRAAAAFLVVGTLMFVLTPTHEMRYYLPLAVPAGILCGLIADKLLELEPRWPGGLVAASSGVALVFAAGAAALGLSFPSPPVAPAHRLLLVAAGVAGVTTILLAWRWPSRRRLFAALGVASLCVMLAQVLGFEPYRARKRDLSSQAELLARHLPATETVWVLGPADETGKHSSLLYHLDRPVRAFRPERELPEPGAWCLFTAQGLERLAGAQGFTFREVTRVEHVWWSFHLGVCTERPSPPPEE